MTLQHSWVTDQLPNPPLDAPAAALWWPAGPDLSAAQRLGRNSGSFGERLEELQLDTTLRSLRYNSMQHSWIFFVFFPPGEPFKAHNRGFLSDSRNLHISSFTVKYVGFTKGKFHQFWDSIIKMSLDYL